MNEELGGAEGPPFFLGHHRSSEPSSSSLRRNPNPIPERRTEAQNDGERRMRARTQNTIDARHHTPFNKTGNSTHLGFTKVLINHHLLSGIVSILSQIRSGN